MIRSVPSNNDYTHIKQHGHSRIPASNPAAQHGIHRLSDPSLDQTGLLHKNKPLLIITPTLLRPFIGVNIKLITFWILLRRWTMIFGTCLSFLPKNHSYKVSLPEVKIWNRPHSPRRVRYTSLNAMRSTSNHEFRPKSAPKLKRRNAVFTGVHFWYCGEVASSIQQ